MKNIFVINDKVCIFAPLKTEDPWCNGSTPDFGSVCRGSNPCGSTFKNSLNFREFFVLK